MYCELREVRILFSKLLSFIEFNAFGAVRLVIFYFCLFIVLTRCYHLLEQKDISLCVFMCICEF